jgi:hypothetical protein
VTRPRFRVIALAAAALLWSAAAPAADEKAAGPVVPVAPFADFGKATAAGEVRVSVTRARGEVLEGVLIVSFTSVDLPTGGGTRSVALADLASIEFVRWQGQKRRNNEYAFYPSQVRVTLMDKSVIETSGIRALGRLRLMTGGRRRTLYSYFFDYREKDAWKNSGQKEMAYPETNPHADTVVKIAFIQGAGQNPLDTIINILKKK